MKNCGSFDYDMAVIGLGYVGLPLVTTAAQSGLKCLGIDINKDIINALRLGASHIDRVSESVLSANSDRLDFECTFSPVVNAGPAFSVG